MNNGAFGENFPYSNFHDLNMDWIIKIAKDFLDQYTHLQETIENGEAQIQELTTQGLEQLEDKAEELENLLQQWYETHSEDIANELASALESLNTWYTTHQTFLDQYVADSIASFNQQAEEKAEETIASIPPDYTTLSNNVSTLQDQMENAIICYDDSYTPEIAEQGKFIYAETGEIGSSNHYVISKPIGVTRGTEITITGSDPSANVVGTLTRWDADGNWIETIFEGTTTESTRVHTVTADYEILVFCWYDTTTFTVSIDGAIAPPFLVDKVCYTGVEQTTSNVELNRITGSFIRSTDGAILTLGTYFYTDSIIFNRGQIITITSRDPSGNTVARMSKWDSNGNWIETIYTGTTAETTVSYIVTEEHEYIRFSGYNAYDFSVVVRDFTFGEPFKNGVTSIATVITENKAKEIYQAIPEMAIENVINYELMATYDNIMCCGDSLTWGAVYTSDNTFRQAHKTYPQIIGIKTGATIHEYATNGWDAINWWNDYAQHLISRSNQLVIIYLGTNLGLTDTIDTDAPGLDYNNYDTTTETGAYCAIVSKAKIIGAKVLLVHVYATSGNMGTDTVNAVIDKIATKFSVAVIDNKRLTDSKYHAYPDQSGQNSIHYNDFGYCAFASYIMHQMDNLPSNMLKRLIPN